MQYDWSHTIKNLIIVLLLLLVVFKCGGRGEEPNDVEVVTYTDTTFITHIDTVTFIKDTTVTKTVLSYTYVERVAKDTSKAYTFKTHVSDSLISGDITTKVKVKDSVATLINQSIAYQPLFPKYIYQTDSIIIHDSTVVTKYNTKPRLLLGADIVFGNSQNNGTIIPKLALELKDQTVLEGGYDIFNNQIVFGAKYKFKRKK